MSFLHAPGLCGIRNEANLWEDEFFRNPAAHKTNKSVPLVCSTDNSPYAVQSAFLGSDSEERGCLLVNVFAATVRAFDLALLEFRQR